MQAAEMLGNLLFVDASITVGVHLGELFQHLFFADLSVVVRIERQPQGRTRM